MSYRLPSEIRKSRRIKGWTIAGAGSLTLAIAAAIYRWDFGKEWATAPITFLGFGLIALGLIITSAGCFWPGERSEDFDCRIATSAEIVKLLKFAEKYMRSIPLPDEQQLKSLLKANPDLYYIIEGRAGEIGAPPPLVGCFTIIPLKQGAVRELEDGELHGSGIRPEHVAKKKGAPKGLYIGIVVSVDKHTSAITLRRLKIEIDKLCRKYRIVKLFTRPMTDDGLKLVRKQKFKNVINYADPEMNIVCRKLWE